MNQKTTTTILIVVIIILVGVVAFMYGERSANLPDDGKVNVENEQQEQQNNESQTNNNTDAETPKKEDNTNPENNGGGGTDQEEPPKDEGLFFESKILGQKGDSCNSNDDCVSSLYCQKKDTNTCDVNTKGVCQPKPEVCIQAYIPVCGCDNQTYGNTCMAASKGVNVKSEGACK